MDSASSLLSTGLAWFTLLNGSLWDCLSSCTFGPQQRLHRADCHSSSTDEKAEAGKTGQVLRGVRSGEVEAGALIFHLHGPGFLLPVLVSLPISFKSLHTGPAPSPFTLVSTFRAVLFSASRASP